MLKLIGAGMIAVVCVFCGFSASDRLKKRRNFLRDFISSLYVLETEISFGRDNLAKIFNRMGGELFSSCGDNISVMGIKAAWNKAVYILAEEKALKKDDITAIKSLGTSLGRSDIEGQKRAIARTRELSAKCMEEAESEYTRLSKTYCSCSVLAGIFVLILFI